MAVKIIKGDGTPTSLAAGAKMEGYEKPDKVSAIMESDTIAEAIGKLEKAINTIYSSGGGGGGSVSITKLTVTNTSGGITKIVASGNDCNLSFNWSSTIDGDPTGNGSLTVKVNDKNVISNKNIEQGDVVVNVKDWLKDNTTNSVALTVSDIFGNQRILNFTVDVILLTLSSTFKEQDIQSGAITYVFTPSGEGTKTMHFMMDDVEIMTQQSSVNNRQDIASIPAQSHGVHTLEVWFTSTIEDAEVESNHLKHTIICTESDNTTPLIAVRLEDTELKQYYTYNVRYQVWTSRQYSSVTLDDGVNTISLEDIDTSEQNWAVSKDTLGVCTLSVSAEGITEYLQVMVVDSGIILNPATTGLELYLTSRGHVVGSPLEWSYNGIGCSFTGFTGAADGWQIDKDKIPVMRLIDNARITIPFKPFGKEVSVYGKTLEFEFATSNVFDYDSVVIDCLSGGRGVQATAQAVTLYSSENTLYTQYKEDEHVRVSFVISSSADETQGNIVYCYINGIMSGAYKFTTDFFEQTNPIDITIGSNGCTTDIYSIRIYDRALTRYEIVDNWLADIQNGTELVKQYEANDIYVNDVVTEDKLLARGLPCLVINGTLPSDKGDKKTIAGRYTDPLDSSRSFTYTGATIDVQGTSSKDYPRKNYKIKFGGGFTMATGGTALKYAINGGIPVNTFTFKADYASSEGANNVELVRLYNEVNPYKTPPQTEDAKVRQGIDGFPIAIFHGSTFIGKYNFNNDKGTSEVFGFAEGDQSWEITGNGSDRQLFKSADFETYEDVKSDFESRYPEEDEDVVIDNLKEMMTWVASTDTTVEGLTEDQKAERLAKFKNEFTTYFDKDSTFFYYLFTEMFLMVDSRAKNAFPSRFNGDGKWCWLPYDMDTAIGIDNGGRLMFSYNLEDTDLIDGHYVYNGQASVLWNNLRECFSAELEKYYVNNIRNNDLFTYNSIEKQFEDHQAKWPVALWNEDAYYKYIEPLLKTNEDRLYMCQGSKAEQRKWWLYNRFRYIDSKYAAGTAKQYTIVFRAYANNNGNYSTFDITPYADIYARVEFDEKKDYKRAARLQETTLRIDGIENPNNLVVRIYSADQLADVGDLSGFLPDEVNLTSAFNLQSIKVGDASADYTNPNLKALTLGSNKLLKSIDARNCVALNTSVDASKCMSLTEAYFDNTLIPSVLLPNGGAVETLHLPASVASLELRNLTKLTELQIAGYENLSRVWFENPSSAVMSLVTTIVQGLPDGARIRARGIVIHVSSTDEIDSLFANLARLKGLDANGQPTVDTAQVSGTIHIDTIAYEEKEKYETMFPGFTIAADHLKCRVRFWTEDGTTLLETQNVEYGATVVYGGAEQTKGTTEQYTYEFKGWSLESNSDGNNVYEGLSEVISNLDLYASFEATIRSYTIQFVNNSYSPAMVLQSSLLPYGELPVYSGATPVYNPSAEDVDDWGLFTGWDTDIVSVVGEATYTAKFQSLASKTRRLIERTIRTAESNAVTSIGTSAFNGCSKLTSISFPNATSIGNYAFSSCSKLTNVSFPKATSIGNFAFSNCSQLTTMYIGTESDTVCTLSSTSAIPSNVTDIYVPYNLIDSYKTATNWSSYANKIKGYEQPAECVSLSITADDVPYGNSTVTNVYYTAECTYTKVGVLQEGTMTFTGMVISEPFEQNTSYTETVQREISFTYLGQTATTTITQGVYVDRSIIVETSGISSYGWVVADETYNVDGYDAYMSDSKGISSSQAVMKLACIGYYELTLYIRSYAESNYDYTIASKANVSSYPTSNSLSDALANTKGNQKSGTTLDQYTAVNYTGLTGNDTIYIVYVKDGSGDSGDDRGFLLIPQGGSIA